jgi:predicted permease
VDSGFRPDHLIAVQFTLDPSRAPAPAQGADEPPAYALLYEQIIEKVRALPGVVSAAAVKDPPFRGVGERNGFNLPGRTTPPGQDPPSAMTIHVSYGYFATIGAPIVDGREFTPRDRPGTPLVVVVNEAFAKRYLPGERAVGQKLIAGRSTPVEIIGVVHDIRQVAVAEPAEPTMYLHNLQNSRVKTTIVARTVGDPLSMTSAIRDAVWSLEPTQPITAVFTFDDVVSRALARPRLLTVLLAAFGVVGLGLGALGLYGVLSFLVQQRRREIGVRLTLGARPAEVRWLFVKRGLLLTGAGVATGLIVARLMSHSLAAVLYGVAPTDAATFGGVALVLFVSAAVASWLPARRAAQVNPVETLRLE